MLDISLKAEAVVGKDIKPASVFIYVKNKFDFSFSKSTNFFSLVTKCYSIGKP